MVKMIMKRLNILRIYVDEYGNEVRSNVRNDVRLVVERDKKM